VFPHPPGADQGQDLSGRHQVADRCQLRGAADERRQLGRDVTDLSHAEQSRTTAAAGYEFSGRHGDPITADDVIGLMRRRTQP